MHALPLARWPLLAALLPHPTPKPRRRFPIKSVEPLRDAGGRRGGESHRRAARDGRPVDPESAWSGYAGATRAAPLPGDIQHRNEECSALVGSAIPMPASVFDIEVKAVNGREAREEILEDPDRVLLGREDEVAERHQAADDAHVPERARDDRLAVAARGDELDQPAAAEHQGAGQADQFPGRDVDAETAHPYDLFIHGRAASRTAVRLLRLISQPTPRRSDRPTQARCRLLYFDTPVERSRWLTGTLTQFQPARLNKAGR